MKPQMKLEKDPHIKDFHVKAPGAVGGPAVFCSRLKSELINQGHSFVPVTHPGFFNNLSCIIGLAFKDAKNILRLDGLYFDSENPNTDQLNSTIFTCYSDFDHIVFQSEFSKQMYETITGVVKPSTIIPNGVPEYFNPKAKKTDDPRLSMICNAYQKVCIASASWRRHKRLEETIEAFDHWELEDVCLLVLGGEEYRDKLDQTIPSNVYLLPKFAPEELPQIYALADCMIHLSWLDWCPNTVVEALACGVPVLCSDNGGTKELVRDNGTIICLEDKYEIGTRVPLYSPPKVDIDVVVDGIVKTLKLEKGFSRDDLKISEVATKYLGLME